MTFHQLIDNRKVHNSTENVPLLCMLNPKCDSNLLNGLLKIIQTNCVMYVLESVAKEKGTIYQVERMLVSIE